MNCQTLAGWTGAAVRACGGSGWGPGDNQLYGGGGGGGRVALLYQYCYAQWTPVTTSVRGR